MERRLATIFEENQLEYSTKVVKEENKKLDFIISSEELL